VCDGALSSEEIAVVVRFVGGVSGAVYWSDHVDDGRVSYSEWFVVFWDGQGVIGIDAIG